MVLLRVVARRRIALAGLSFLALISVLVVFGSRLTPYDPIGVNPNHALTPPSLRHPFGTDQYGRDIFSRVIAGANPSIMTGIGAVVIALVGGLALGLIGGMIGGWTDLLIMRLIDTMMAFPGVLLALMVVAVVGRGRTNVMIAVGVSLVPTFARLVRGDVLVVMENAYIEAARAVGCSQIRLAVRHVLPNILASVLVLATIAVAWSIITGAAFSFLGLGPTPPTPEWGTDISNGRLYLLRGWWLSAGPGLSIVLTVVATNLVGDTLRDVLDPRLRSLGSL